MEMIVSKDAEGLGAPIDHHLSHPLVAGENFILDILRGIVSPQKKKRRVGGSEYGDNLSHGCPPPH